MSRRQVSFGLFRGAALVSLAALSACGAGTTENAERYELKGSVVSVDREKQRVVLAHEEVPGYMPAMTMPFRVKDRWVIEALEPGRIVHADLVVATGSSWIENVTISSVTPSPSPTGVAEGPSEPVTGVPAPPIDLVDHERRRVELDRYRGKALALTFIYTRCPIPDYCPLMTENFAVVERELRADPRLAGAARLLSISIDPEYDTPEVMRDYARRVAADERGALPKNWDFATGSPEQVRRVAEAYGLVYETANDQVVHTLRTAVIAPDGTLYKVYRGNEWKPHDLVADLVAVSTSHAGASR